AIVVSAYLLWYHYSPATVTRAYFGTDSRVFQPLMGSALAIALALHPTSTWGRWSRRTAWAAAGTVALTGLVVLTWMLDGNESAYFRWGAIAVGVLSLVVIIDGEVHPRSPVSRFLALKPLVLLGTISYGFYLWHWPVIQWIRPPDGADFVDRRLVNLAQFAVSLAAAVASYILVERPVRLGRSTARVTLPAALVGMLVVAGAAGVVLRTESTSITITTSGSRSVEPSPDDGIGASDGVETSDDGTIAPDEQLGEPTESTTTPADTTDDVVIEIVDPASDRSFEPCPDDPQPCVKVDGVTEEAPTVVLVGDSTAQAYDPALQVLAEQHGFRYVQAAVGGCPIGRRLLATGADGELHKPSNFMCFEETPGIYDRVVQEFEADLILATSWNETNQHVTEDGDLIERGTEQHIEQTRAELENSLDALTNDGAELVFIEVLPRGPSLDCLETSPADAGNCVRVVDDSGPEVPINELFGEFTRGRTDVLGTVSFLDRLCPDSACPLVLDGMVVRYDGTHFTGTQSRALAPELDAALLELGVELADLEDRGP
ncbi:MAG: acyltransferase family protein, partial [Actinomycetota bacterium]